MNRDNQIKPWIKEAVKQDSSVSDVMADDAIRNGMAKEWLVNLKKEQQDLLEQLKEMRSNYGLYYDPIFKDQSLQEVESKFRAVDGLIKSLEKKLK